MRQGAPLRPFANASEWPLSHRAHYRYAHIVLTPHQFRHLSAKIGLDAEPGNFENIRQLLGHKTHKTTTNFYSGINTRRAARHHQRLIERALDGLKSTIQRKMPVLRSWVDKIGKGRP